MLVNVPNDMRIHESRKKKVVSRQLTVQEMKKKYDLEFHDFPINVERFNLKVDTNGRQVSVSPFVVLCCVRKGKCKRRQ